MSCASFLKDSFPLVKLRSNYCMEDVDAEVALHLQRLGRKDPTTKAFKYRRLLLDYNQEVRRATHKTMTSLVTILRFGWET
ncbi:hypothetical protein IHE45_16G058200 [Dioscorea alata]|uniref:Uncharacterized protein n=1 Tax=Dioscorea alata TaxID=55571 RepID=A0ACB7UHT5_DIOAL|nr:hypothetical protein IHE45_16G058200 [Dioscorea alata]